MNTSPNAGEVAGTLPLDRAALHESLLSCMTHFESMDRLLSALRLLWDYPDPACFNTAAINRLAEPLGRGPVFREQPVGELLRLSVNHPTEDAPAFFAVSVPGRVVGQASDYARRLAADNLAAWDRLALARAAAGADAAPHPDGPDGGCWVWYRGKRHDVPTGVVYRLIAFMWGRDAASIDALERAVFETMPEPQTVRSLVSKANEALRPLRLPWRLTADTVNRFVRKKPADA